MWISLVAVIVVLVFGALLIAFTVIAFGRPDLAKRFLTSFASSARTHYVEMVLRLLPPAKEYCGVPSTRNCSADVHARSGF